MKNLILVLPLLMLSCSPAEPAEPAEPVEPPHCLYIDVWDCELIDNKQCPVNMLMFPDAATHKLELCGKLIPIEDTPSERR